MVSFLIAFFIMLTNIGISKIDYYVDPTHDITCGFENECIIQCETSSACSNRIFIFLNDWGVTKTKHNSSLICTGSSSCYNIILIANTSSLYLDFQSNDGWSMEAYINFGSATDIQRAVINCGGQYSCDGASFIFNSMLDTDQGNDESETIENGIVDLYCMEYGACESMVLTAFQIWEINIKCYASHSCHTLTVYSPIKYHVNYFDSNTNLECNAIGTNGSYDNACSDVNIFQWAGTHLVDILCNDEECIIDLNCGLMFEYNCNYFDECLIIDDHPCNNNIGSLNDNQIIASPNILIMDYTGDKYKNKEIYIYISTLYEKFIYFHDRNEYSWSFNATYPIIYCPIDGSCNIICGDIGYAAHYDHCAYGIYYGNYSESMTIRGYEADNSIFYGATSSFWWRGLYGNQNILLNLKQTFGNILINCNGTSDIWDGYAYSGCQSFTIITSSPEIFEMNCNEYESCENSIISTDLGFYNNFPEKIKLNCEESTNITDHTTCRGIYIVVGDESRCEYSITTKNGIDKYWDCINWESYSPTINPTINPTIFNIITTSNNNNNSSSESWLIPLIVVLGLLICAMIVFGICKKYGKPQLPSFMKKKDNKQGFVGLNDSVN